MKYLISLIFAFLLGCGGTEVQATDYHICDCQTGADGACVAGDNARSAATASNAATPWLTWSGVTDAVKTGNNRFLFCRGGVLTGVSIRVGFFTASVSRCSATAPCEWNAYTPSWCSGGCTSTKPILKTTSTVFDIHDGSAYLVDGGYSFKNLELDGTGGGLRGIFISQIVNNVLIDSMNIHNFSNCVYSSAEPFKVSGPYDNTNIILRNSTVTSCSGSSWLGGANGLLIENNTLSDNGSASILDHDIYLQDTQNTIVRGNTITDTTLNGSNQCIGSVIVVHGRTYDTVIENNSIIQPGALSTCFGIEISYGYADTGAHTTGEAFRRITIRGNKIVNVGYNGIVVQACTDCIVDGNSLVWTDDTGRGNVAISQNGNAASGNDETGTAVTIRNNSIYMNSSSTVSTNQAAIDLLQGSEHVVTNNLIFFGPSAPTNSKCFETTGMTLGSFTVFDYNLCWSGAVDPPVYSQAYATLASAQAAGFDTNGLKADPVLVATPAVGNGYSMAIQTTSPAKNTGSTTYYGRLGFGGVLRDATPDIGAYEFGASTVAPTSPSLSR